MTTILPAVALLLVCMYSLVLACQRTVDVALPRLTRETGGEASSVATLDSVLLPSVVTAFSGYGAAVLLML